MSRANRDPLPQPAQAPDAHSLDALLAARPRKRAREIPDKQDPTSLADLLQHSQELSKSERVTWWEWRRAVGERIATRSMPDKLDSGTLLIVVKSSLWAQELSLHGSLIIDRLRPKHPALRALRFRVGAVEIPEQPVAKIVPKPAEQLPDELERRLEMLDDSSLRDVIRTAASFSLGRAKLSTDASVVPDEP